MGKMLTKVVGVVLSVTMFMTSAFAYLPTAHVSAYEAESRIQAELFVSPTGSDTNDGSYEKPFATMQAARDAVRKINSNMTGDIYVFIAGGNYYLDETIAFNEKDSGSNGYKVIYRNLDEVASAQFIGGQKVKSDWQLVERTGADADLPAKAEGKVYKTHVGTDVIFDTLYVNDRRATLARTQNLEKVKGFDSALTPYMRSAGGGIGDLIYKAGDIDEESINGMVNAQARGDLDASVYMWDGGYWDWMTDTIPVSAIDTSARRLTYKTVAGHPEAYRPKYATRSNARYFVQGNLGFLDIAGEYYFNKTTGDLYYYPEGDINTLDIVVPHVKDVIKVEGSSRANMAENIEFSGLQFKDTNTTDWYAYGWNWGDAGEGLGFYPVEASGSTQPSYCEQTERIEFQHGVIMLTNTKNVTISKSHIKNAGLFGINMYLANQNATVKDCLIEYTGHGGVSIDGGYPGVSGDENGDGYSRDNVVTNTIIHNIGELIGQATGLTVQQSSYNTFSNLEVYNSPRRGLFITAGNSRNPKISFPNGDKDFNIMTDMYTHHNTFEYCYVTNCQQDGGDDGAFFGCYLYKGDKNYKPNYLKQTVIDTVGANPTMTDLGCNGINLDMGCSGFELSNVKSVNPMNFNMEVNTLLQYNDQIKFDNTNINYGTMKNQIADFDDSKMEYENIGITADYPKEYMTARRLVEEPEDIYFKENFEAGIDTGKWSTGGADPKITTEFMSEGALNGKQSMQLDNNGQLSREFDQELNKVVSVKMFDRQNNNLAGYDSGTSNSAKATSLVRADDGENIIGMGMEYDNMSNYVVRIGDQKEATNVRRTFGWHEFKFDYTSKTDVKMYIDGTLVKTIDATGFDFISMGSNDGKGRTYYDQLYIYGGEFAEAPGNTPIPAPPVYDNSNDNKSQLSLDFEDGKLPEFYFTTNDPTRLGQEITDDATQGKVLKHYSGDGHAFYKTGADWNNYLVNLKWKFAGWGDKNILDYAYDNFTIYIMTTSDGSTKQNNNPPAYQVIYRRNKNGTAGFPAGTAYFEISKHTPSSDSPLGRVAVPEGFNDKEWHDFQIQTFGGKVGFMIDGKKMLSIDDGAYTHGGVGFGGINATVYMDDIEIISNPTYVNYDSNLGLSNATLNGAFNPDHFTYKATVTDKQQPVVMTKPTAIVAGAETTILLNGEDITASFVETGKATLNLLPGENILTINEVTVAGSKSYKVYLGENSKISSVGEIANSVTTVGVPPVMPATANVIFSDGSSKDVNIIWDTINPAMYKQTGIFNVTGVLAGLNYQVKTQVTVNGIKSVSSLNDVITKIGEAPKLPATVLAQFSDGDKNLGVKFIEVDPAMYNKAGTVILIGDVDGYGQDVLQKVVVTNEELPPATDLYTADLEALISYAKAQKELAEYNFVVPAVKAALDARIIAAETAIKEATEQGQIDLAYDSLLDVVHMLSYTGDNTTLLQKYNVWKEFNPAMYTPESAKAMTEALAIVKVVIDNENALQDEINTALAKLETAIDGMVLYTANKDALRAQIEKANKYNANLDKYIDNEGKTEFIAALVAANDVVAQDYPTQETINSACARLMRATWGLREIPNKDKLQEIINQANAFDVTGYTVASVKARAEAIAFAQTVMTDKLATQEDVNEAIAGINRATRNLVLVTDEKTEDKETTDKEATDKETTDKTTDKTEDTTVPTTSDTTPITTAFALAMMGCACVVVRKKSN